MFAGLHSGDLARANREGLCRDSRKILLGLGWKLIYQHSKMICVDLFNFIVELLPKR